MTSSVEHVQSTWTDLSNITRCQITTSEMFESHFKQNGFSLPYFILSVPYMNQAPYERVTGEVQFFPDREIPRPIPWLEGAGIVFGTYFDGNTPWSCCPRTFLMSQEAKLKETGIKLRVGFEMEFYLLNMDGTPVNSFGYGETKTLHGKTWKAMCRMVAALKQLRIPVWKYHAEAGSGQYEISMGPFQGSMLEAADAVVLARQAIYHIAAEFDFRATFLPKPVVTSPGSSIHTHISLWGTSDKNLFAVSAHNANSFLAGIFNQLPSTTLIFCPTGNSYDRLGPKGFTGTYHCIGNENRKAAIRLFRTNQTVSRFEIRNPDGTSNPYLVLGTLIGAGIHGVQQASKLPPLVDVDPSSMSEYVRPVMLPTGLGDAIDQFEASTFCRELYGDELFNLILLVRKGEEAHWSSDASLESKMKLLLTKY